MSNFTLYNSESRVGRKSSAGGEITVGCHGFDEEGGWEEGGVQAKSQRLGCVRLVWDLVRRSERVGGEGLFGMGQEMNWRGYLGLNCKGCWISTGGL